MTAVTIIVTVLGLALVPVLDPDSRRWLRARARLRRLRRLEAARVEVNAEWLRARIAAHESRAEFFASHGFPGSERRAARRAAKLRRQLARPPEATG